MVKRILLIVLGLLLAAGVWPAYSLGVAFGFWQPLTRPSSVSASAHYASQLEDGTWFDCSVDLKRNVDVCKGWDSYGRLLANGDFRLDGEDRAASAAELRPAWVDSGGGHAYYIYLFGKEGAEDRVLVPVDVRHPHADGCKWDPATNSLRCD